MQTTSLFGQLVGGPTESSESVPSLNVADTSQQQNALSFADVLSEAANTAVPNADGTLGALAEAIDAPSLGEQSLLGHEAANIPVLGTAVSQEELAPASEDLSGGVAVDVPLLEGTQPQFFERQTVPNPKPQPTEVTPVAKPIATLDQAQQALVRVSQFESRRHLPPGAVQGTTVGQGNVASPSQSVAAEPVQLNSGRLAFAPALSNKSATAPQDPSRIETAADVVDVGTLESGSPVLASAQSGSFQDSTKADVLTNEAIQPLPVELVANASDVSNALPVDPNVVDVGVETRLPGEDISQPIETVSQLSETFEQPLVQQDAVNDSIVRPAALTQQVAVPVPATEDRIERPVTPHHAQTRAQINAPLEPQVLQGGAPYGNTATQSAALSQNASQPSPASDRAVRTPEGGVQQREYVVPQGALVDEPVEAALEAPADSDGSNPGTGLPELADVAEASPQTQTPAPVSTDSVSQPSASNAAVSNVGGESQQSFDDSGEPSDEPDSAGEPVVQPQSDEILADDASETVATQQSSFETQALNVSSPSPGDTPQSVNGMPANSVAGADTTALDANRVVPNAFSMDSTPVVEQSTASPTIMMPEGVDRVEVTNRVVGAISQLAETTESQFGNVISLELEPAELGRLSIRVEQSAEMITAQIIASESVSSELLQSQKSALLESLNDLGFESADVDISHKEERDSDSNSDSNSNSSKRQYSFAGTVDEADSPMARAAESSGLNIVA